MSLRITFTILFLSYFSISNAQSIQGQILDSESQDPIPYTTIILSDQEGNFIAGESSDDDGKYLLQCKNGNYKLELSFIGYETSYKEVSVDGDVELDFIMQNAATTLGEVTVTAERTTVEQLIDKKVINVGTDLLSSGGDATTVLSQLSEVNADENGNVSLRGNENVNILVNGKPSPLSNADLLQQISSNEISKIEIITSPSAKYQASGLTGIINIITNKKVQKGLAVTTNMSVNTLGGYNPNVALQYGRSKVNYKLGGGYTKRLFRNNNTIIRTGIGPFSQLSDFEYDGDIYSLNGGMDWFISDTDEFSISADYKDNGHDLTYLSDITQGGEDVDQERFSTHSHITFNGNANYRHYINNKKGYLEIDAQISENSNILFTDFLPNLGVLDNQLNNDVLISNVALDFSNPLSDDLKLEAGLLWNRQSLENVRNRFTVGNEIASIDNFENILSTYAAYGLVNYKIENLTIQAGLRGELYSRDANLVSEQTKVSNKFNNLFPSFHLNYSLGDGQTLTFGYNRRTSRPRLGQVNPNPFQSSEFSVNRGNPYLEPEFSNNLELNYQYKKGLFNISPELSYRLKNHVITRYQFVNDDGLTEGTYMNNGKSDAMGIGLSTGLTVSKWLESDLSYNWFYEQFRADQIGFARTYSKSSRLTFKNTIKYSKQTNMVLTWRHSFASEFFNSDNRVNQNIDLAIRHKILNNAGSLSLRITDIFNTRVWEGVTFGDGFTHASRYKPFSRVAHLAFSYTFKGGKDLKNRKKKSRKYESGVVH